MFFTLFLKECKQMLKSLIFYLYIIILGLFYITQMGEDTIPKEPKKGQESYGYQYAKDETRIMEGTLGKLVEETYRESYPAYPFGFYKSITLIDSEQNKIYDIIEELSGKSWQEFQKELDSGSFNQGGEDTSMDGRLQYWGNVPVKEGITYEKFVERMEEVDDILGGGTQYAKNLLYHNADQIITYEQAKEAYQAILKKDEVTGAWARLFCDYMGILLGILPVFMVVTRGLRDKRAQAEDVIYARKASSLHIIGSRYLAILSMCILPIFVLAVSPTMESIYFGHSVGASADVFGFVKYILGWLTPTVTMGISIGFFFTVLTDSAVGILVQGIWWITNVFVAMSKGTLEGAFGWNLIPRWNTMGATESFFNQLPALIQNRIFYLALSLVLFVGTVVLYELRRRGKWQYHGTLFGNRKNKSEI